MHTATRKGPDFEKHVEQLLTLMGYRVSRNNLINGTQIDLVAEKKDLLNNLTFVVECTDREETVGVDLVKQKAAVLLSLHNTGSLFRLLFVARNGFTAEAKAFATSQSNVLLLKPTELERQLIDFGPYATWYTYSYSRSEGMFKEARLHQHYVELAARDEKGTLSPSLTTEVAQWLKDSSNNLLFLLGEFGSGKTSFCRQFAYSLLARKYVQGREEQFTPILISLREYRRAFNIQQVVTDTLVNQYGVSLPSFVAFERLCGTGTILLLLDGFDEMADRCDSQTLIDCFTQIFLLASVNTKVVVTCRSNVFKSHSDLIALLKHFSIGITSEDKTHAITQIDFSHHGKILYVEKLNEQQVRDFISKRFGDKSDSVFNTIRSVHDLSDLATRPVLLDMMLTTLPALIDSGQRINSAALYQHYIERWTARDIWRVSTPPAIREQFCETLSWLMHTHEVTDLTFPLLETLMRDTIAGLAKGEAQLEKFKHDVQICSFLVGPDNKDSFRFAHKSFLEFLVARKIAKELSQGVVIKKAASRYSDPFKLRLSFDAEISSMHLMLMGDHITNRLRLSDISISRWAPLSEEAMLHWKSTSTTEEETTLRSAIEKQLLAVFRKQLPAGSGAQLGVTEEIATFALEYLENQNITLQQLISVVKSPEMIDLLADLVRLSKSSDYTKANAATAKEYIAKGNSHNLKIAFCAAVARVPEVVTIDFVNGLKSILGANDWSYFLFELARTNKYSEILSQVYSSTNSRQIDRVICAFGRSTSQPVLGLPVDMPDLVQVATRELLRSSDRWDISFGLSICPFLNISSSVLVDMMLEVICRVKDQDLQKEAAAVLQSVSETSAWQTVRIAASKQSDPGIKALLQWTEQRIRDATSKKATRSGWQQSASQQALRERIWNALRR